MIVQDMYASEKVLAFNADQLDHIRRVQGHIWEFCHLLVQRALWHDASKFEAIEYEAFLASRDSLNASKDGKDEEYQKHLRGRGIQHHLETNSHHPEFWDARKEEMPIIAAIIMYFDWLSRCEQKKADMQNFREYNYAKLKCHPGALALVKYIERRGIL
jgi:hypothetical protein